MLTDSNRLRSTTLIGSMCFGSGLFLAIILLKIDANLRRFDIKFQEKDEKILI